MHKRLDQQVKSKQRVNDHGEVFTAEREVNAMLDLVKQETERIDSRFLEPACGTGNFLVEVLKRKLAVVKKRYKKSQLEYERYAVITISSIYGIDLLPDNIEECKKRLFTIFNEQYKALYKSQCKKTCKNSVKFILDKNILRGDALTFKMNEESADCRPIVFSEWTLVSGSLIQRRDFIFSELTPPKMASLFQEQIASDLGRPAFIPTPVRTFPLKHFLNLAEDD